LAPTPTPYLAGWEEEAITGLGDVAAHDAIVCFPFFANTLPLAFHYFHALVRAGKDPADRIQLYEWGDQERILHAHAARKAAPPLVFYASAAETYDDRPIDRVPIGTYSPGAVFTEMNLMIWEARARLVTDARATQPIPFSQIAPVVSEEFSHVEVFSDIQPQAEALLAPLLRGTGANHQGPRFLGSRHAITAVFDDEHTWKRSLRIFLYGGPMTLYLRKKRSRYIPFAISPQELGEAFSTVVAISAHDGVRAEIHRAIKDYHVRLDDAATTEVSDADSSIMSFRAIQYYYNRLARLLAHRSSFPSSFEYARCIVEHKATA
jgi:hypothetical protein